MPRDLGYVAADAFIEAASHRVLVELPGEDGEVRDVRVVDKHAEVVGAEISVREHVEEDDIDGICDGFTAYNDVGDMDPILIRTQEPREAEHDDLEVVGERDPYRCSHARTPYRRGTLEVSPLGVMLSVGVAGSQGGRNEDPAEVGHE